MSPPRHKSPGDVGAGARVFHSEAELCEATVCPVAPLDGTACVGRSCRNWRCEVEFDRDGVPVAARCACQPGGYPPSLPMGQLRRRGP